MPAPYTPWRKAFNGLFDSPKTYALATCLNVEHLTAYGLVNALYEFAQPTGGYLSEMFLEYFEKRAHWPGRPGAVIEALSQVGFLDPPETGSVDIHDYVRMQGSFAEKARKAARQEKDKPARVLSSSSEAVRQRKKRARREERRRQGGGTFMSETGGHSCPRGGGHVPLLSPKNVPLCPPPKKHRIAKPSRFKQSQRGGQKCPGHVRPRKEENRREKKRKKTIINQRAYGAAGTPSRSGDRPGADP